MNFVAITYQNIKSEIETFLKNEHNKGTIHIDYILKFWS